MLPNGLPVTCVSTLDLEFLYDEIFISQIYLQHGVVLKAGEVVLDVGANIGLFSAFAAQRVGSKVPDDLHVSMRGSDCTVAMVSVT